MTSPPRDSASMRYLESLQHEAMINFAPGFGQVDEDSLLDAARQAIDLGLGRPGDTPGTLYERLRAQEAISAEPGRWSKYEPPAHRTFLSLAEQNVIRGFGGCGLALPPAVPAMGTLPTSQLNAQAIPVPDSEAYVIAFESGLFDFTSAWAKIASACLLSDRSEPLSILFIDLVFSQVVIGSATFAENNLIALDPGVWQRGHHMLKPVYEAFLLAHEYGHVMLGHRMGRSGEDPEASYERELAADAYGFRLMLAAFENPIRVYDAVASLLCGMQLFEHGYDLLEHEQQTSATHPRVSVRRAQLYRLAQEWLPGPVLAEAGHWVAVIENETIRLWEPLEWPLGQARQYWPQSWVPGSPEAKRAALRQFLRLVAEGQH